MPTLFEHPLSPYAQKVKIALREKGIDFEAKLPMALGTGATPDPEFLTENPRLEVPLFIDGEVRLFDSTVILEYVEDRWPSPPLRPDEPAERAQARTIEDVLDTHYEANTWGMAEVRYFGRASGELATALESATARNLAALHHWLESRLSPSGWLVGGDFGWADLAAVPFVNGASGFGMGPQPESRLATWLARANERESVAETAAEAAAAMGALEGAREAVERGLLKRLYRDHRLEWMIRSGGLAVVAAGLDNGTIRFTEFPGSRGAGGSHR